MNPKAVGLQDVWKRIVVASPDECWLWPGSTDYSYGTITIHGKLHKVHRVVCELAHGKPSPEKPHALHSCDNPLCCNPSHLRWGTHAENMADKALRGGSTAKLPATSVMAIRRRALEGERQLDLAAEFKVNSSTISRIVGNLRRKYVE